MSWVGTWGCALYHGDDTGDEGKASALRVSKTLPGATLRQIIRTSIGGERLRLGFSNEYGQMTMTLREVHIARASVPACPDIDAKTDTAVTFGGGSKSIAIPAGERAVSDAAGFPIKALERLAVTICFGDVPGHVACHAGARANSFVLPGNAAADPHMKGAAVNTHWFALSNVDVEYQGSIYITVPHAEFRSITQGAAVPRPCSASGDTYTALTNYKPQSAVVLGDSITDGYGVAEEQYTRWTDVLAECLQANPETQHISVINMGIGTNKLLGQKNPPAAIDRFERDVLSQPGIGYFIFFIGVNDLADSFTAKQGSPEYIGSNEFIDALEKMTDAAKARDIKVYGCTIIPFSRNDKRRCEINGWLRGADPARPCRIDGLIDFDALLRNPANPGHILPQYDSDGIHPSITAYRAMGEYVYRQIDFHGK